VSGPYETERQAADAARHIYDSPPGTGAWGTGSHRLLEDACTAAGVRLGAYDQRILLWLAGQEPSTCAVIAGLITRARQTTGPAAGDTALARRLAHMADTIDTRLAGEHADRQTIAEDTAAELRALATAGSAAVGLGAGQLGTILDALDQAAEYKRDRAATCPDCDASPAELCGTCEWRLARADEYDALAETLRGQR
jgi:hypothetical protein